MKKYNEMKPSKRVLARLEERGEKWKLSPWVFPSMTSTGGKIAEPRIAHVKALEAAKLLHVSPHGLRRPFGSRSESSEFADVVRESVLRIDSIEFIEEADAPHTSLIASKTGHNLVAVSPMNLVGFSRRATTPSVAGCAWP